MLMKITSLFTQRKTMTIQTDNLFNKIPFVFSEELFQTILEKGEIRIERIVSNGQATPAGEWYDQGWDEWVLLVSGGAGILFVKEKKERKLGPGDYLLIPAGCRHRVVWTKPGERTIWLAVHFGQQSQI